MELIDLSFDYIILEDLYLAFYVHNGIVTEFFVLKKGIEKLFQFNKLFNMKLTQNDMETFNMFKN